MTTTKLSFDDATAQYRSAVRAHESAKADTAKALADWEAVHPGQEFNLSADHVEQSNERSLARGGNLSAKLAVKVRKAISAEVTARNCESLALRWMRTAAV